MHGSSGTTAGDGIWTGTSSVVSALAKEEDGSSLEGTGVSSGGAGEEMNGCTGAEGAAGAMGKDSSSLSWETGGPGWLDTTTEGGTRKHSDNLTLRGEYLVSDGRELSGGLDNRFGSVATLIL